MTEPQELAGSRRTFDQVHRVLMGLFLLGCAVQFYLAGQGVFGAGKTAVADAKSLDLHRMNGSILSGIAALSFIALLVARPGKRTLLLGFLLIVLVEPVQHALAQNGSATHALGGLHALNGLLIVALAAVLYRDAARRRPGKPEKTGDENASGTPTSGPLGCAV